MLNFVSISPYYGEGYNGVREAPIVLPLGTGPYSVGSQYFIKNIEGLGPTKAEIVTASYVGMPGTAFQAANVASRNIVAQVGVDPDYSIDDPFGELRRALYPFLNPGDKVELQFTSDENMEVVTAVGYLESFEPSIFSSEPMQTLSFICPDPYFYSKATIQQTRMGAGSIFLTNPGTAARTGMTILIDNVAVPGTNAMEISGLIYPDPDPRYLDNKTILDVGTYTAGGEPMIFKVVTVPGKKSAGWMGSEYYHDNVESGIMEPWETTANDLLGYIDGWAYLHPGVNEMEFNVGLPAMFADVYVTISFTPRYVGL